MATTTKPHLVVCRECYDSHLDEVARQKADVLHPRELRQKVWGQRYLKNRTPRNRVRIAYAAYLHGAAGDDELLSEIRAALLAYPVHSVSTGIAGSGPEVVDASAPVSHVDHEAQDVERLDAKLSEDRSLHSYGPGRWRTRDGHWVRSKSERDIANFLFDNNIRYQYERPTWIGGVLLRPDFFLPDVDPMGLILEHFGMMDDDAYRDLACRKARLFDTNRRFWIATDENDAVDMDEALRAKLSKYFPRLA